MSLMNLPFSVSKSKNKVFVKDCSNYKTKSNATITTFLNFYHFYYYYVDDYFSSMRIQKEVELSTEKVSYAHSCDWPAHYTNNTYLVDYRVIQMVGYWEVGQRTDRYNA